jgi:hypothetical protein
VGVLSGGVTLVSRPIASYAKEVVRPRRVSDAIDPSVLTDLVIGYSGV